MPEQFPGRFWRTCRSGRIEDDVGNLRIAEGQGSRLVERDDLDFSHLLEEHAPLDQHALAGARAKRQTRVIGIEIMSAQGEAATINTVGGLSRSARQPAQSSGRKRWRPIAATTTIGLYRAPNFSMNLWLVPFFSWASSTIWMMRATVLSATVLVALTLSAAGPLMLAAKTGRRAAW